MQGTVFIFTELLNNHSINKSTALRFKFFFSTMLNNGINDTSTKKNMEREGYAM